MNWDVVATIVTVGVAWGFIHWIESRRYKQRDVEQERILLAYEKHIGHQYEEIKDLRDRLFQSKAMPPSGVDLTEVYEERKQKDREHKEHSGKKVPAGPIERLVDKWAEKDRKAAEKGIDFTEPQHRAN